MKYVIIGNGVAGTTAAAAIRKTDAGGEIQIITEEAYPFYSRIRLMGKWTWPNCRSRINPGMRRIKSNWF
jgi:NADPH-dependent 2,4-dienoyl-CoA reductase/sulfur reductase-like enzyme